MMRAHFAFACRYPRGAHLRAAGAQAPHIARPALHTAEWLTPHYRGRLMMTAKVSASRRHLRARLAAIYVPDIRVDRHVIFD